MIATGVRPAGTAGASRTVPESSRDLVLDLVRAGSLAVVVLWHWVFTTVRWGADGPHVGNPIGDVRGLWLLTWLAQVMPLFFIVGGALHARDRRPAPAFWSSRLRRLLPPALPLLGGAAVVALLARTLDQPALVRGVVLLISPLWFLAVYLMLVGLAPAARWLHRRAGWGGTVGLGLAVLVFDRARLVGLLNGWWVVGAQFILTWGAVHQLGFHLRELRLASRHRHVTLALAGFGALALGAVIGGYPLSMVGVPGEPISNLGPPTVMVLALGLAQLGLLCLADRPLRSLAERHRSTLATISLWSMTVYVWHMLAFAAFWALLSLIGVSVGHRVDASWWLARPLWLVGPLMIALPACAVVHRSRTRAAAPVRRPERAPWTP